MRPHHRPVAWIAVPLLMLTNVACAETADGGGEGPLLVYEVTGGIAGFCERLEVHADGTATVTSCRAATRTFTLPDADRRAIEAWVDRYGVVDETRADPEGAADRMVVHLVLNGRGTDRPDDLVLQGMFDLAARLTLGADRY